MFGIEVEFLTGVSVATSPYRVDEPEWPPHPDRLFQALVAAWARNEELDEAEKQSLHWLESIDYSNLEVQATKQCKRLVRTFYVPANDLKTPNRHQAWETAIEQDKIFTKEQKKQHKKKRNENLSIIPEYRSARNPRTFPAVIPLGEPPIVRYIWIISICGIEEHQEALSKLVREVTYLGHSHTLVRVSIIDDNKIKSIIIEKQDELDSVNLQLRCPYKGRLDELMSCYSRNVRPNPSTVSQPYHSNYHLKHIPTTVFDNNNVFEIEGIDGFSPLLTAFPAVAKRFRDALMKVGTDRGLTIPTLVSGYEPDKKPTTKVHMSIVPLADVGWQYSHGRLMGLGIVLPRNVSEVEQYKLQTILTEFLNINTKNVGSLHFGKDATWKLALATGTKLKSLNFGRYTRKAKIWGTVLPAILDRFPKNKNPNHDTVSIIARSCRNIGLSEETISGLDIELYKNSPINGAPTVIEVSKSLPKHSPYSMRPITHLVLKFSTPVQGPLIIGAGRFRGLGLCLPMNSE